MSCVGGSTQTKTFELSFGLCHPFGQVFLLLHQLVLLLFLFERIVLLIQFLRSIRKTLLFFTQLLEFLQGFLCLLEELFGILIRLTLHHSFEIMQLIDCLLLRFCRRTQSVFGNLVSRILQFTCRRLLTQFLSDFAHFLCRIRIVSFQVVCGFIQLLTQLIELFGDPSLSCGKFVKLGLFLLREFSRRLRHRLLSHIFRVLLDLFLFGNDRTQILRNIALVAPFRQQVLQFG